jgi:two-component system OmpR family response regulator
MLTAKGGLESRVKGLDVGADDYLVKPFAFDELLARLRAITRRLALPPRMFLEVGPLRLDLISHIASRDGTEIMLTAREYVLLEVLMRNPGRVFTRTELLARICNEDDEILVSTIETYVSSLRSKIDKPFIAPHLIKTIWGQGYRLCL